MDIDPMVSKCEIGMQTLLSLGTGGFKTLCWQPASPLWPLRRQPNFTSTYCGLTPVWVGACSVIVKSLNNLRELSFEALLRTGTEVLGRRMEMLEKENTYLELRLRMKEEELEDFQTNRRPLEKAYRSLQRRYGRVADRLDMVEHRRRIWGI